MRLGPYLEMGHQYATFLQNDGPVRHGTYLPTVSGAQVDLIDRLRQVSQSY